MRAIIVAAVSGILLLASGANVANARGNGYVARPSAPRHLATHHNRALRRLPLHGSFIAVPAYPLDGVPSYPPYAPFAPDNSAGYPTQAAPVGRCLQTTHKIVTVPAESGGTREVTVTYCYR
jgi:hypothetical protein